MSRRPFAYVSKAGNVTRADVLDKYAVKESQQIKDAMHGFVDPEKAGKHSLLEPLYNPNALTRLLEINTYHMRACRTKARDVAGKGWSITPDDSSLEDDKEQGDETIEKQRLAIEQRLRDFSTPVAKTLTMAQMDFEAVGWGAVELIRETPGDVTTDVIDMWHIPAHTLRRHVDETRWVQVRGHRKAWFKAAGEERMVSAKNGDYTEDVEETDIANEVMVWDNYTARSDWYGLPDIIPALGAIMGDVSRRDYNIAFFDNYGVPAYAVMISGDFDPGEPVDANGDPDPTGQTPLEREIEEHFDTISKNPHSTLVMSVPSSEDGEGQVEIEIKPLSVETKEASFRMYRTDNRDEVLSAHGVDPYRVGIAETGSLGGSTAEQSTAIYKESVIEPRQADINDLFNKYVVMEDGWVFALFEIDTSNPSEDLTMLQQLFAMGAVTPRDIAEHFADRFGLDAEDMKHSALNSFYVGGAPVATPDSFEMSEKEKQEVADAEAAEAERAAAEAAANAPPEEDDEEPTLPDDISALSADDVDAALLSLRDSMLRAATKA